MAKHTNITLEKVAHQIEDGFAAVADDIGEFRGEMADLRNDVTEMRSAMVTKTDYHALRQDMLDGFKSLHVELRDINRRLDALDQLYQNLKGVTHEIDDLRDRVREIERHLGINKKIAA